MVLVEVELAILQNRLARAAQHLARAAEELRDIDVRLGVLAKEGLSLVRDA